MRLLTFIVSVFISFSVNAQQAAHPDTTGLPLKLEHAEPLYIDLIRDLGAHKGEKEWNIGAGMIDNLSYDRYEFLVEYEWAPINRLGLEVEVPVSIYTRNTRDRNPDIYRPSDRIESLKLASQYTFLVSKRFYTSMAIGQITEFELTELKKLSKKDIFEGVLFNPFLVVAKRWGQDLHSLVYSGPRLFRHFNHGGLDVGYELNTSLHYMIPHSRNFVGLEVNQEIEDGNFHMTLRPQMRLVIHEGLMIGIVSGIPVSKNNERLSSFVRLIYEPGNRKRHGHQH